MSTLEERREARRRRRQEDESGEIESTAAEEDSSFTSRRSRRQQEEDSYEDTSSSRPRRRRGYGEEDSTPVSAPASAPEPVAQEDTSAEDRRSQKEEEERKRLEKERRQQEEEEEAQRQAEAEEERRKQEEEARRRRQEEERKRVEEERRRRSDTPKFENVGKLSNGDSTCDRTSPGPEVHRLSPEKLKIWSEGNDGKGEGGKQIYVDRGQETQVRVKEKLEKFEQIKNEPVEVMRTVDQPILQGQLRDRLQKFERDVEDWIGEMEGSSQKNYFRRSSTSATENTPTHGRTKLQSRLQQFENQSKTWATPQQPFSLRQRIADAKSLMPGWKIKHIQQKFSGPSLNEAKSQEQRKNKLGQWSISETRINVASQTRGVSKNSVLERWKFADNSQKQSNSDTPSKLVPDETLGLARLSGNTEFKASRLLEKVRRTSSEISPGTEMPTNGSNSFLYGERPRSSQSSDATSDYSETGSTNYSNQDLLKMSHRRWSQQSPGQQTEPALWQKFSPAASHSQTSSYDNEEEERLEKEKQDKKQKEAEEAARMAAEAENKKKKGKRKGLGGLSPEKKKILKKLIMQKAAEDLKSEALAKALEKEKHINERVEPLTLDGLDGDGLKKLCKALHAKVAQLEEEVYDWEFKIRRQETEINELTLKVNDSRGKFVKPVLRKVNKTESKFDKLKKEKEKSDFRSTLKSHKDEEDEAREAAAE
ncbi:hypothetical protein CHS0354_002800 [Potamilus streckersoni]|uniref:Troponin I n=1 Tax=Potamilus streckersoni TaxID=2493646 RepID=A0AAE0S6W4_9BIVA|nr:hypothetical protein CHS0354_002800 [Potamilus streckersoni]